MQTYVFDTPAGWCLVEGESPRDAFNLAGTDFVESESVQEGVGGREEALSFARGHLVTDCTIREATEDDLALNLVPVVTADKYDEVIEFIGPDEEPPLSGGPNIDSLISMLAGLA